MIQFSEESAKNFFRAMRSVREFVKLDLISFLKSFLYYMRDLLKYIRTSDKKNFSKIVFYPCLQDKLSFTPVDPIYFFQDTWAARKIFELKPPLHVDLASSTKFASLISQFTPTIFVDIRPVLLKTLGFIPFASRYIEPTFQKWLYKKFIFSLRLRAYRPRKIWR